jgi:hypothetical protein
VAFVTRSSSERLDTPAYGALIASNPAPPLPTEYPDEVMPITLTFYYNETPGSEGRLPADEATRGDTRDTSQSLEPEDPWPRR